LIKTNKLFQGKNNEFHFLIASEDNEVQIYFYDGWKFLESPVDFTGDAFGAGVVNMRGYDDIINGTTTVGELIEIRSWKMTKICKLSHRKNFK
jgi:hypothetical protein